jgi:hypothetical protein
MMPVITLCRRVDVQEVLEHGRDAMQDLFDVSAAVVERGRDRTQPVDRDTHCFPVIREELAHVDQRLVEALHRMGDFVGCVRQHRRHAGQVLVKRGQQIAAGVQR